ncbi:MAG: cobalamin-binding protein [Firmicutes bacterium]|nr:cobalamin-binding protein [Bacillota bacterium]
MNKTRVFLKSKVSLAVIIILLVLSGSTYATEKQLTVTDQADRVVTLEAIPVRIVSLAPGNTEILYALGLADNIVGVSTYCDYPEAAVDKPKIGGFSEVSIESVVALEPDVVFATGGVQDEVAKQLTQLGLKVIILDAASLDQVLAAIALVGQVTGRGNAARELIEQLEGRIDQVKAAIASLAKAKPRKVFYEVWYDPPISVGPGSFIHDLIETAGGINLMAGSSNPYPVASLEEIIDADPDVIIYAHGAMSTAQVAERDGWRQMEAVRTGRIVSIDDENILVRPGPRIVEGLEALAEAIYPEAFDQ